MGQYYMPYVERGNSKIKFSNSIDGDWNGLKLMEHSYWRNQYVGQVINNLFYNKARVCWVGDYYEEDDYSQINVADKQKVAKIGAWTWSEKTKETESHARNSKSLTDCLLVNHTKKVFINGNEYYANNKWVETWNGKEFTMCVNPLPLLTCSANHSGGSYYGINKELCGTWFYDELEVMEDWDEETLVKLGYAKVEFNFTEHN